LHADQALDGFEGGHFHAAQQHLATKERAVEGALTEERYWT
jgi:hypothetical protein